MIYKKFSPSPQLQEFVKTYHLLHFKFKGLSITPLKTYFPKPEQCLTFDPYGHLTSVNKQTGDVVVRNFSYLSQQQTNTYDLTFPEEYLMLKVVFQPGALHRLLGIPLDELGEKYIDAELVIPSEVRAVNEQLASANSYDAMIKIVDSYLIGKIKKVKVAMQPIDFVIKKLTEQGIAASLDWVANEACLSLRQLERKYLERLGVSPILYNRLLRFNKAVETREKNPLLSWSTIAVHYGFTDLSHLVKDFKHFSGLTPTSLAHEEANSVHYKLKLV